MGKSSRKKKKKQHLILQCCPFCITRYGYTNIFSKSSLRRYRSYTVFCPLPCCASRMVARLCYVFFLLAVMVGWFGLALKSKHFSTVLFSSQWHQHDWDVDRGLQERNMCKIRGWGLLKLHLPSYKHFLQLLSFLQGAGVQCYCSDVALFYTASSWVLSKEMKRRECCQKELYLSLSKYSM